LYRATQTNGWRYADSNKRLSQNRADTVKGMLIRDGVSPDRIAAQGYGEENPIADNATGEGRQLNRRVSVVVGEHLSIRGSYLMCRA
jgi:outer membrane protein OmpA-like peptidoglycan-associated protein